MTDNSCCSSLTRCPTLNLQNLDHSLVFPGDPTDSFSSWKSERRLYGKSGPTLVNSGHRTLTIGHTPASFRVSIRQKTCCDQINANLWPSSTLSRHSPRWPRKCVRCHSFVSFFCRLPPPRFVYVRVRDDRACAFTYCRSFVPRCYIIISFFQALLVSSYSHEKPARSGDHIFLSFFFPLVVVVVIRLDVSVWRCLVVTLFVWSVGSIPKSADHSRDRSLFKFRCLLLWDHTESRSVHTQTRPSYFFLNRGKIWWMVFSN